MEFIDSAVLQRADDIFTNDSGGGLGGLSGRDHRRGSGSSVGGYLSGVLDCPDNAVADVPDCRWRHLEWVAAGSRSRCTRHMFMACSVLPGCELCSCSRCACLSACFWGCKQRVAHEDPRSVRMAGADAAPGCMMAHFLGFRSALYGEHEHCSTRLEACLDCQCHTCAVWTVFGARARRLVSCSRTTFILRPPAVISTRCFTFGLSVGGR